jgi:hypothetical protein
VNPPPDARAVVSEKQQVGFQAKFESDLPRRQQRIENSGVANAIGARIGFPARAPGSSTDCEILPLLGSSLAPITWVSVLSANWRSSLQRCNVRLGRSAIHNVHTST